MADIVRTAARIRQTKVRESEVHDFIADVAIVAGQPVYVNTAGGAALADANGSGTTQGLGVALNTAPVGGTVSVLKRGFVAGYTVAGMAYGAPIYLSNTVGEFADAAGAIVAAVGRVMPIPDGATRTKVAYFDFNWGLALA